MMEEKNPFSKTIQCSDGALNITEYKWLESSDFFQTWKHFNGVITPLSCPFPMVDFRAFLHFIEEVQKGPGEWMENSGLISQILSITAYFQNKKHLSWAKFVVENKPRLETILKWEEIHGTGDWKPKIITFLVDSSTTPENVNKLPLLVEKMTKETLLRMFQNIVSRKITFDEEVIQTFLNRRL